MERVVTVGKQTQQLAGEGELAVTSEDQVRIRSCRSRRVELEAARHNGGSG
jgi:hypothetical protein